MKKESRHGATKTKNQDRQGAESKKNNGGVQARHSPQWVEAWPCGEKPPSSYRDHAVANGTVAKGPWQEETPLPIEDIPEPGTMRGMVVASIFGAIFYSIVFWLYRMFTS